MKILVMLILVLSFTVNCNSQNTSKVISISHVWGGGDGGRSTLIGVDNKNLTKTLNELKLDKVFTDTYVINKKPFEAIKSFVSESCDSVYRINQYSSDYFIIRILGEGDTQSCYLENKEVSKIYFERLIKSINNSPYKNECKQLITELKGMLKSVSTTD